MFKNKVFKTITIFCVVAFLTACTSEPINDGVHEFAGQAKSAEMYEKLGIKEGETAIWEDGMRTDGKSGSYEWWYVDMELNDGITVVAAFYTTSGFDISGPSNPNVKLTITYPDGTEVKRSVNEPEGTLINASKEKGDVSVGDSYLKYVDGDYQLYFNDGSVEFSAFMKSTLPMWRPDTGYSYFDDKKENFMAWFVAQPSSDITANLTVDGVTKELKGTGYHDHNWGNISMDKIINHWYWGRAKVGEYNIIASDIISKEETGFTQISQFMLAKDGVIFEFDQSKTVVIRGDTIQHPVTGKFYDNSLTYIQESDDGTVYKVEFIREKDIAVDSLLSSLSFAKRTMAKMMGANPTYIRTLGKVILTIEKDGKVQVIEQEGLWEQMFFGNNKKAYIWN